MWWLYGHMKKPTTTSVAITAFAAIVAGAYAVLVPGCGNSVNALSDGGTGAAGTTGTGGIGGGKIPVGQTQCSDGIDNDGDGKIDYADPECVGPLDNDESSYATGIPGDNVDSCKQDCFFDGNSGMGDDGCDWQLKCDPRTTNAACPYDQAYAMSHTNECSFSNSQSQTCIDKCQKLVPNGCDCFGCCAVPGTSTPIRLVATCTAADFGDPTKCPPCTQVTQCMTPCGHCDYCIGKETLPADCATDGGTPTNNCPTGYMACGVPGGVDPAACPVDTGCVTGCCRPLVP
jgi:hypothetical protein